MQANTKHCIGHLEASKNEAARKLVVLGWHMRLIADKAMGYMFYLLKGEKAVNIHLQSEASETHMRFFAACE